MVAVCASSHSKVHARWELVHAGTRAPSAWSSRTLGWLLEVAVSASNRSEVHATNAGTCMARLASVDLVMVTSGR